MALFRKRLKKAAHDSDTEAEMSFIDHLEELTHRLRYMLLGVLIGLAVSLSAVSYLVEVVLLKPAIDLNLTLQNLRPFGQVMLYFEVAIISGIILSIPNIFYQLWKFVSPALRSSERKYIVAIVVFSTLCFAAGIAFAYFIMLPMTLKFAADFGWTYIKNEFAMDEYVTIFFSVILGAGLIFELPMLSFFLSKLGILTPQFMRKYRKHAIVILLIMAAVFSPGTDPVGQIVLSIPLFLLYEISIIVSQISVKKS
ncbi:Sec-independent protein translocase protein TatC [uncultured bacterium]|nr:Sec-independent protein translocase protein TatC [uncultured bacterium]